MITEIINSQDKVEIPENVMKSINLTVERTLRTAAQDADFEVSVLIIDNVEMNVLNLKYRNIDAPTDVLSFPMDDYLNEIELDVDLRKEIEVDHDICEYDSDVETEIVNYAVGESGADIVGYRGTYIDTDLRTHSHLLQEYAEEVSEEDSELPLLGDIIISAEKAQEQAEEYNHSLERELCYLTVHGVLHLLGYDHEDDDGRKKMREIEEMVLADMGLSR